MKHNVKGKKLGRDVSHRKALLRNMAAQLIEHGSVETTLPKAKYLRPYVEKLITKARKGDNTALRAVQKKLVNDEPTRKLMTDIAPQFAKRPGGYTRIVKLGFRDGDKAAMARIELILDKKAAKKKTVKAEPTKEKIKETPKEKVPEKAKETKPEKKEVKEEKKVKNEK